MPNEISGRRSHNPAKQPVSESGSFVGSAPLNRLNEMIAEAKAMGGDKLFILCSAATEQLSKQELAWLIDRCAGEMSKR